MKKLIRACLLISAGALFACGSTSGPRDIPPSDVDGGKDVDGGADGGAVTSDEDGDRFTLAQGDCDDRDPMVNPGAFEVAGNGKDDDCNDQTGDTGDSVLRCDPAAMATDALSLAHALDLCDSPFFKSAQFADPVSPVSHVAVERFGNLVPTAGRTMLVLSSGLAADTANRDEPLTPEGSDLSSNTASFEVPNPFPVQTYPEGCYGLNDERPEIPTTIFDPTALVLELRAPSNAKAFSFDFFFMSAEYPFLCLDAPDQFLVLRESATASAENLIEDADGIPMSIRNSFFTICEDVTWPYSWHCQRPLSELQGTGFEQLGPVETPDGPFGSLGGGTGWLRTTAPVRPGEELKLRFLIHDGYRHGIDSTVLVDNFRWLTAPVLGSSTVTIPSTAP